MTNVFKEQVTDLENILPNFKIASAIIHYDETSPHLHIIGVPIKTKTKNGMSKQVGKSSVFTKESLLKLQDKMRTLCIESFNKEYLTNNKLKTKLKGRNKDYHITEMENYQRMKRNIEIHQNNLDRAKEKTETLTNNSKEIRNILENLKSKGLIKNQLILDVVNKNKLLIFIDLVDRTIAEYQSVQELSVTLKEMERELIANRQRINLYVKNNKEFNIDINNLKTKIKSQNNEINDLKKENTLLKSYLNHFKTMIFNLIQFLIDKIYKGKDKEKYMSFAKELYEHSALDKNDFELISNPNKSNNSKDYHTIKEDEYEK